jgi:hypothetical protein
MSELRFDLIDFGHGLQNSANVGNPLDAFGSATSLVFEPPSSRAEPVSGESWGATRLSTANLNCICADGLTVLYRAGY